MLYLLAILVPPLAVLLIGKPVQAVLNLVLPHRRRRRALEFSVPPMWSSPIWPRP